MIPPGIEISPERARPGDLLLINGPIAQHGIAIMSVREGLAFETTIESDSASLHDLVAGVLAAAGEQVHVLRDPTRGGLSSTLNEIAVQAAVGIRLNETSIPIHEEVRGACEILGLDPLYVANEGKCLLIVAREAGDKVLAALRRIRWATRRPSSARWWRITPARLCCAAASAASASWTCSAANSCRGFAKRRIARSSARGMESTESFQKIPPCLRGLSWFGLSPTDPHHRMTRRIAGSALQMLHRD